MSLTKGMFSQRLEMDKEWSLLKHWKAAVVNNAASTLCLHKGLVQ
jgi:hypothetical protein